jgi:hypothetical protein
MADFLDPRSGGLPSDARLPQEVIVQLIQGVLLCVLLWYALKIVLREPVQGATPAPDAHWSVAFIADTEVHERSL